MSQAPVHPASGDVYHDATAGKLADALSQGVLLARDGCVLLANRFLHALAGRGHASEPPDALLGLKLDELFEDSGRGLPRDEGFSVVFTNIPEGSRILVFTTAGDRVVELPSDGLAGRNMFWDTHNENGEELAAGTVRISEMLSLAYL